jgi:hypothetical protein
MTGITRAKQPATGLFEQTGQRAVEGKISENLAKSVNDGNTSPWVAVNSLNGNDVSKTLSQMDGYYGNEKTIDKFDKMSQEDKDALDKKFLADHANDGPIPDASGPSQDTIDASFRQKSLNFDADQATTLESDYQQVRDDIGMNQPAPNNPE